MRAVGHLKVKAKRDVAEVVQSTDDSVVVNRVRPVKAGNSVEDKT